MYRPDLLNADIKDCGITKTFISKKSGIPYKALCRKIEGSLKWKLDEAHSVGLDVMHYDDDRFMSVFFDKS